LHPYPTGSPKRRCALHRCARAISGASFVCPTIRDHERKGTGMGMGGRRGIAMHVKRFKVCADLGDELLASLVVEWQPHGWPSVWRKVRKTKVQLADPHNRHKPKKKKDRNQVHIYSKNACSSQSIFDRGPSSGFRERKCFHKSISVLTMGGQSVAIKARGTGYHEVN